MSVKINRLQLIFLLKNIKFLSCPTKSEIQNKTYIIFKPNNVELSHLYDGKITIINIAHESYIYNTNEILLLDPSLLLEEINNLPKNKFINLSIIHEKDLMKIESVNF